METNLINTISPIITAFNKAEGKPKVKAPAGEPPESDRSSSPPPEDDSGVLSTIANAFEKVKTPIREALDEPSGKPYYGTIEPVAKAIETGLAMQPAIGLPAYLGYEASRQFIDDPQKIESPLAFAGAAMTGAVMKKYKMGGKIWQMVKNPVAKFAEKFPGTTAAFGGGSMGYLFGDDEGDIQKWEMATIGAILGPLARHYVPKIGKEMVPVTYKEGLMEQPLKWLGRRWMTAEQRFEYTVHRIFGKLDAALGMGKRESLQLRDFAEKGLNDKEKQFMLKFLTAGDWDMRSIVKGKQYTKLGKYGDDAPERLWYENRVGRDIMPSMLPPVVKPTRTLLQEVPHTPKDIYKQAIEAGIKPSKIIKKNKDGTYSGIYPRAVQIRRAYQEAGQKSVGQKTFGTELVKVSKDMPLLEHAVYRQNLETYFPRIFTDKVKQKFGETAEDYYRRLNYKQAIKFNRFMIRNPVMGVEDYDKAGILMEPAGSVMKGYADVIKDVETFKMYKKLALNPYASAAEETAKFSYHMPNKAKYGALADRYVKPGINYELQELDRAIHWTERFLNGLLTPWKVGKVILSPTTHARNIISNMILADLGGLPPWRMDIYAKSMHQLMKKGKYYQMAKKDLLQNTFIDKEVFELMGPIKGRSMMDWTLRMTGGGVGAWAGGEVGYDVSDESPVGGLAGMSLGALAGWKFTKHAGQLYQASEQFFKMAKFIHNVESKKMATGAAIADANKWLFNYGDIPSAIRTARTYVHPFATFSYKAIPRIAETAVTHPWRLIKYQIALNAMLSHSLNKLDMSKKEWDDLQVNLGDHMKHGHYMLLPARDERGKIQLMDFTYIFPWGDINEVQAKGMGRFIGNPLLLMPYETMVSKRNALGVPIYYDWNSRTEKAQKLFRYIGMQMSPSLTPGIGYNWEALNKAFKGTPDSKTLPQAVGGAFMGLKVTGIEPQERRRKTKSKRTLWKAEAKREMRKKIDSGVSRERAREEYRAAIKRIYKQTTPRRD